MSVTTLRLGLWRKEEVDFGNQCRAEPHTAQLRLLSVCCRSRSPGGRGFWRCATIPKHPPGGRLRVHLPGQVVAGSEMLSWAVMPARGETCNWGKKFQRPSKLKEVMCSMKEATSSTLPAPGNRKENTLDHQEPCTSQV